MQKNMIKKTHNVIIIGLGNIGMKYDLNDDSGQKFLTHANAFANNDEFTIVGGVDLKEESRKIFNKKYKSKSFNDIKKAMIHCNPDIVVISSPTNLHFKNIKEVFKYGNPEIIMCEKPLSYDYKESLNIVEICEKNNTKLYVNYLRRAEPGILKIKSMINSKKFTSPFKGLCWYSKGIFNSSSHMIDLLQFFFGEIKDLNILSKDLINNDLEIDFQIKFNQGEIIFLSNQNKSLDLNGLEIVMQNGILKLVNGGSNIFWQSLKDDKRFEGYKIIEYPGEIIKNDFEKIQLHVVEQLSYAIKNNKTELCSGRQALKTDWILSELKKKHDRKNQQEFSN